MYPPPPPPRSSHQIPAAGVIVLALGCLLFGCVGGASIVGGSDPDTAEPVAAPKPVRSTVTVTATIRITPSPTAAPTKSRPTPTPAAKPKPAPKPKPRKTKAPSTDPRFGTCTEAKANGYGHYRAGEDPEYNWYEDRDNDGVVCE